MLLLSIFSFLSVFSFQISKNCHSFQLINCVFQLFVTNCLQVLPPVHSLNILRPLVCPLSVTGQLQAWRWLWQDFLSRNSVYLATFGLLLQSKSWEIIVSASLASTHLWLAWPWPNLKPQQRRERGCVSQIREMSRDITVLIFTRLPPSSVWVAVAQLSLWEMGGMSRRLGESPRYEAMSVPTSSGTMRPLRSSPA